MKQKVFDNYANAIASEFNLSKKEIFTKKKSGDLVDARQMLYYLCMERPMRISSIQKLLKKHGYEVGHSTIISGYKKAKLLIETDSDYLKFVQKINRQNTAQ